MINSDIYRDEDGDGYWFFEDAFDDDATEYLDSDNGGTGDNADAFPNDATEDTDSDNDGVGDNADAFPNDDTEAVDSDNDGTGDNADAFPNDATEDTDSDNDGVGDNADAFPNDDGKSMADGTDTDTDGYDDNLDIDADGDGYIDISTLDELNNIRNNMSGTAYNDGSGHNSTGCGNNDDVTACSGYELINDLDFDENGDDTENDTYNTSEGWTPIGDSTDEFRSIFEGNNYTISNLYINNTSIEDGVGLFGEVEESTIQNLHVTGNLTASSTMVGGLVGKLDGSTDNTLTNISFVGTVTNSTDSGMNEYGGLFGRAENSNISECYANVAVYSADDGSSAAADRVGGLVDYLASTSVIENCFTQGSVNGEGNSGGAVGNSQGTIRNVASSATVNGSIAIGGLVGSVASNSGIIENSFSFGVVTGGSFIGGLTGADLGTTTYAYWDTSSSEQSASESGTGYTTSELQAPTTNDGIYASWSTDYWDFGTATQYPALTINGVTYHDSDGDGTLDGDDATETADSDNDGVGDNSDAFPNDDTETSDLDGDEIGDNTDDDIDGDDVDNDDDLYPYDATGATSVDDVDSDNDGLIEISTLAELNAMRDDLAGASLSGVTAGCAGLTDGTGCIGYELTADLDFDTDSDGDLSDESYYNSGEGWEPVGSRDGAFAGNFDGNDFAISNLFINRSGTDNLGLFGRVSTITIENLTIDGDLTSVTGDDYLGLLIGRYFDSGTDSITLNNITLSGDVSGDHDVGLLAGTLYNADLDNISATGSVTATDEDAGSIAGQLYGDSTLDFVDFEGTITGVESVGGLVGDADAIITNDSYALVTITATGVNIGGLFGEIEISTLNRIFAEGSVTGTTQVGGLIGDILDEVSLTDAYSSVSVTGDSIIGGIAGQLSADSSFTNVISYGLITTTDTLNTDTGVILGYSAAHTLTVSDAHWDTEATEQSSTFNSKGTANTTAELQCPQSTLDEGCSTTPYDFKWSSSIWDFGTSSQYPALILNSNAYRDADDDGYWIFEDAFDDDATEYLDSDNDGVGDNSDAFPNDATETLDSDLDGVGNNEDTDDDNDGVLDVNDENPLVAGESDTQAPVISAVDSLSFEATGIFTQVSLTTPQVSDDNDINPSISSDLTLDGLALGEHTITWTATDASGNVATALQQVTIVDTTAPVFDTVADVTLNAQGYLTDISSYIDVIAIDAVDGYVQAQLSQGEALTSGAKSVEINASDLSGNTTVATMTVNIIPEVTIEAAQSVLAANEYIIPVQLTGSAVNYPVSISYELIHNNAVIESASVSIESGLSADIIVNVPEDTQVNNLLTLDLISVENAFIAS